MQKLRYQLTFNKFFLSLLACASLVGAIAYSTAGLRTVAQEIQPTLLAQTSQAKVNVKDTKDLQGFKGTIQILGISPNGKTLMVAMGDGKLSAVDITDLDNTEVIYSKPADLNIYSNMAVSSDGKFFVAGEKENVVVFNSKDGRRRRTLRGHVGRVSNVALSPDNKMLVSVSGSDRTMKIWDLERGNLVKTIGEDVGPVTTVSFSPDGKFFVVGAIGQDRTLKFWDAETLELLKTSSKQPGYINSIAITPDGQKLVAAVRNFVKVWDLNTGKELLYMKGPSLEINTIAVSPNSRLVATANKEGTIMLFDIATGRKLQTLTGHQGWVLSLAFSPDGKYLYTGAEDKIIKVWEISR